jgi:Fic family protein
LAALTALPGVAEAVEQAREAGTTLRWHPALRRRMPEARTESSVRAARASAALDGAELPLDQARTLLAADADSDTDQAIDPIRDHVLGALRATLAAADAGTVLATAPAQAFARIHLAAAAPMGRAAPDELGRPRPTGVPPRDLADLGAAPEGTDLVHRLDALVRLIVEPTAAPALVVAAVVHGELLVLRPFTTANGLVARAVARTLVVVRGLDPTGVAVPEVGWLRGGSATYISMAAAYASGTAEGVGAWIRHCASAFVVGAQEGTLVADAVLAGRLQL